MNHASLLEGKTILVVGAAGRLGKSIVLDALAAGANVMALDCDADGLTQTRDDAPVVDGRLQTRIIDITCREQIAQALEQAVSHFGGVDGAVNSAYPRNAQYGRQFFDVAYADFCENTNLHLGGYFLFMQACTRYAMANNRAFSLVNLSSIYGSMAPRFEVYTETAMTMPVEYAAIKAGLEHMTRYVNAFMKGKHSGFRANCVSPGGILAGQDEKFLSRYSAHCLSKGMLDTADVTGAILFLLSDDSKYLTGQNLIIDDGFSI